MSDNDLGVFLRARRESVQPTDVGLATGGRRRTPARSIGSPGSNRARFEP